MAASDWTEIYRSYTTEELLRLQTSLKAEAESSFVASGRGNVNHQKDLREVRDKLQAVVRVLRERSGSGDEGSGVADFSGVVL